MDVTDIKVLCPANPYDPGRKRLWATPAAAAWFVEAARAGVDVDPLPDDVPDLHSHAAVVLADGCRYVLVVTSECPALNEVRAVPESEALRLVRERQNVRAREEQPPF